jgi:IPT/TIG domain
MQKLNRHGNLAVAAMTIFFLSSVAFGQVDPASQLNCNPSSVTSGMATTCTVTLSAAAPASGIEVLLSSNNALFPVTASSVTVPAGATSTTFTVTAGSVGSNQSATLTATALNSVMLNWTASTSQNLSNYNVYRSATSGGPYSVLANAGMATSYADYNVQNGQSYYYVTAAVNTAGQESAYSNQATAAVPTGISQTAAINLVGSPAALSSLTCNPGTLTSGATTTCTVALSGVAPTGGSVVSLASNNALLPVPTASVTVPSGAASTTFTATAGSITVALTATLTATLNGASQSASISLTVPGAVPPTIASLNPTSGSAGTAVTITGTNFGSTQGTSTVTFNGTAATVTSWSATSLATSVPTGATTGNVVVTVAGLATNGVSFTVTSMCGETGQSGTDSKNADWAFGTPCVTGSDANGYTPASIQYWVGSPTSTSFDFGIYADSSGSPGSLLCHTGTTTLTPTAGWNNISLSGKGCATLSASTRYWLGYITGSNTIEQGTVNGDCPGTSLVSVYASSVQGSALLPNPFGATTATPSCYSMFLVLTNLGGTTPTITSLSPTSGPVGTAVTITGTNFGSTQGTSTVTFNGTAAAVTSWSATSLATSVPTGATTGNVVVTVGGVASNGVSFTVVSSAPSITSLSPTSGPVGTTVTITGTNFGSTQGTSTVTFNGTAAAVTSWSATSLATSVPTGATTGNVVVTVGGVASNGMSFTVTTSGSAPTITSLNPTSGSAGTAVTITGTNFGSTQGTSTVTFNGTAATVTSWSATSLATSVPTGATTGNVVVTVAGLATNGVSFTVTSMCGETGQSGTDSKNADWAFGTPCVTGSDANGYTPASIQYWVGSPTSTSFDFGIYADSSGSPGSLLCHTGTTTLTPTAGWNNISLSGKGCATLSASTRYWLGYITGSNTIEQGTVNGDCPGTSLVSVYASSVQGSALLPNPFGATTATPSCYSMFLVLNNK